MFNVTRTQLIKNHTLFNVLRTVVQFPVIKTTYGYMAILFISFGRMPILALTLHNADPIFALVITSGFYLHRVEVADQDPASGSL